MNELEAKVRCLEMAERIALRQGQHDVKRVAELATTLYDEVCKLGSDNLMPPAPGQKQQPKR